MQDLKDYLSELEVYPSSEQIDEASNFAQEKATDYVHGIDADAIITVDEGEFYIKWVKELEFELEEEFIINAQSIFDENFSCKLEELQGNNDYKAAIIKSFNLGTYTNERMYQLKSRISDAINYAWSDWDNEYLKTYYEGEKPKSPTEEFIENWIQNEDFEEAWASDIEEIKKLFK